MKKDRSNFTREELLSEIELFEHTFLEMEKLAHQGFDTGFKSASNSFESGLRPLYFACFDPQKGWIGTANLSGNKVGKPLLEYLSKFHGVIK